MTIYGAVSSAYFPKRGMIDGSCYQLYRSEKTKMADFSRVDYDRVSGKKLAVSNDVY